MVLRGTREKTVGGLTAKDIIKNKYGKLVSKSRSMLGKKNPWNKDIIKNKYGKLVSKSRSMLG